MSRHQSQEARQRGRNQRTGTRNTYQLLSRFTKLGKPMDRSIITRNLFIETLQFVLEVIEQTTQTIAEVIFRIFKYLEQPFQDVGAALGWHETTFHQQSPNLLDLRGPILDQLTTNLMDRLDISLLNAFDRDKTHAGTLDRLTNGLGFNRINLVGLDEGFHNLGRN